jgi:hypothetical protein
VHNRPAEASANQRCSVAPSEDTSREHLHSASGASLAGLIIMVTDREFAEVKRIATRDRVPVSTLAYQLWADGMRRKK